jgi:hypothetical protein
VKDLYNENYKTMKKEIGDDIKRGKNFPCSCISRIDIVKIVILLKATYRFSAILTRLSMSFSTEIYKLIPKFMWKHKTPQIAKTILKKNSLAGGITILDFKLYSKAIVTKTA